MPRSDAADNECGRALEQINNCNEITIKLNVRRVQRLRNLGRVVIAQWPSDKRRSAAISGQLLDWDETIGKTYTG